MEKAFSLSLRVWAGITPHSLPCASIRRKCSSKWVIKNCIYRSHNLKSGRGFKLKYSGNIREGEVANLVMWNGDPFEMTTEAEMVMIAGEKIKNEQ